MRVLVDIGAERNYTYEAPEGTKAGDTVTVPGPPWNRRSTKQGTVLALESDYDGPVRKVLGEWPDDRPYPDGRSNDARLARWLVDNKTDRRIRSGGTERVCLTGGELWDLLYQVVDRFYHHGTADVEESPRRVAEFYAAQQVAAEPPDAPDKPPY